jgi:hypothetical protein
LSIDSIEYRNIGTSEPLRQGDIIEARNNKTDMWERTLVVITADCDFAHAKHEGNITCIPLLTADEYLLNAALPRLRDKLAEYPKGQLKDVLKRNLEISITDERLLDWVNSVEIETIRDTVQLEGDNFMVIQRCYTSLRSLFREYSSIDEALNGFVDAQVTANETVKREMAISRVQEAVRDAFRNTPVDAMFLSSISSGQGDGYFAHLRHVTQVKETDVALGFRYGNHRYQRISRLTDRFIHALVQQFALVFLRIGLPKEYEDTRDRIASMKVEDLR